MSNSDLTDMPNAFNQAEKPSPMLIYDQEILSVTIKLHPFKEAGSQGIPLLVLLYLECRLVSYFQPLS